MGNSHEETNNLYYQRIRDLAQTESELISLRAKGYIQKWFPIKNGMGWIWDENEKSYVLE